MSKRNRAGKQAAKGKVAGPLIAPEAIFTQAVGFEWTACLLDRDLNACLRAGRESGSDSLLPALAANVVTWAFCTELYLKCMIRIESNANPPEEHNLEKLFAAITPETRQKIKASYVYALLSNGRLQAAPSQRPEYAQSLVFENALKSSSNAFIRWRYCYENPSAFPGVNPVFIGVATRLQIFILSPSCQAIFDRTFSQPTSPTR